MGRMRGGGHVADVDADEHVAGHERVVGRRRSGVDEMSLIQVGVGGRHARRGWGITTLKTTTTSATITTHPVAHDEIPVLMTMMMLTLRRGRAVMTMRMIMMMMRGATNGDRVVRHDHRSGRRRCYVVGGSSLRRDDGRSGGRWVTKQVVVARG